MISSIAVMCLYYLILALVAALQASSILQDFVLMYCISCETWRNRSNLKTIFCLMISFVYFSLRLMSITAASAFVTAVIMPEEPIFYSCVIINVIQYLPFRLVCWICCLSRQMTTKRCLDAHTTHISVERSSLLNSTPPLVIVIIPCYKEPVPVIERTLNSILESEYALSNIRIYISFDGLENAHIYEALKESIQAASKPVPGTITSHVTIKGAEVTLCLFEHRGKSGCQQETVEHIKHHHSEDFQSPLNSYILFLDSDTTIPPHTFSSFANRMYNKSLAPTKLVALSSLQGIRNASTIFLGAVQEVEYLQYGIHQEVVMSTLGNVICLSGTLIYVRLSILLEIFEEELSKEGKIEEPIHEHWKHYFGEDRFMTQLLSRHSGAWSVDIHTGVVCETQPAVPLWALVLQRRRWFLGTVATDASSLCDIEYWKSTPLLLAYRLLMAGHISDLQVILLAALILLMQLQDFFWVPWTILGALSMNILTLVVFQAARQRLSLLLYPLSIFLYPLLNVFVKGYALVTLFDRGWGGERDTATHN